MDTVYLFPLAQFIAYNYRLLITLSSERVLNAVSMK